MLKLPSRLMEVFGSSSRRLASTAPLFDGRKLAVITLDAMNTIIRVCCRLKQRPGNTYAEFAKRINIDCCADALNNVFRGNFKKLSKKKLCYGYKKDGAAAWWTELIKNCFADAGIKDEKIDELGRKLFDYFATIEPWDLVDKQRGIRLAVISNFDGRLRKILDGHKLSAFFEAMFLSGEIGTEKPNRQVFEKAAKYFEITNMDEMLHVGDDEDKDFNGARNAGARALIFSPEKAACDSTGHVISSLNDIILRLS
ncbi:unnamed protein product [Gongylonema pulchrum]|uniref:Haloacid dehalogenase-like hydrolase domain-containing protein 3 n=1 Tax=Gongylonema pulchrum TaxID=637853 RepID=A0A183DQP1_9BILA|nr:unnamed protein product [Gongylonema pulchrum]